MKEPIRDTAWYSLEDYLALLKILAKTLDPAKTKGDPYRYFGVFGARRDFGPAKPKVPGATPEKSALARGAVPALSVTALKGAKDLADILRRVLKLRERYYSCGYYRVKRVQERTLMVTLLDFPASVELCSVSTGYLTESLKAINVGAWIERRSCKAEGHADCRWELRFASSTDVSSLSTFS